MNIIRENFDIIYYYTSIVLAIGFIVFQIRALIMEWNYTNFDSFDWTFRTIGGTLAMLFLGGAALIFALFFGILLGLPAVIINLLRGLTWNGKEKNN